jgi:hypothetical protein
MQLICNVAHHASTKPNNNNPKHTHVVEIHQPQEPQASKPKPTRTAQNSEEKF